jgi:molybdopterin synthase catalytic subunit
MSPSPTPAGPTPPDGDTWIALGDAPLPGDDVVRWATLPRCGGVVAFHGVTRDHADGREGVTSLAYEAWEEEALSRMSAVADEARRRWPEVARIGLLHRLGDVPLGEASVLVVASAPHRGEAFDAARFCIDTLKETVPIWKKETWAGGSDWAEAAHPIRPVGSVEPTGGGPG